MNNLVFNEKAQLTAVVLNWELSLHQVDEQFFEFSGKYRQEHIEYGPRLGWLIDSESQRVFIFQPQMPMTNLDKSEFLSADDLLIGFRLELQKNTGC